MLFKIESATTQQNISFLNTYIRKETQSSASFTKSQKQSFVTYIKTQQMFHEYDDFQ